jgi:hypothetical protein
MDCETAFLCNHQVAGAVHTVARIIPGNLMMPMISKSGPGWQICEWGCRHLSGPAIVGEKAKKRNVFSAVLGLENQHS